MNQVTLDPFLLRFFQDRRFKRRYISNNGEFVHIHIDPLLIVEQVNVFGNEFVVLETDCLLVLKLFSLKAPRYVHNVVVVVGTIIVHTFPGSHALFSCTSLLKCSYIVASFTSI
jgi:hypothetical protein